jgi:hypothetical protein
VRRRPDLRLLVPSLVIALGIVLVVFGFLRSVTGREAQGLPDAIESLDPVKGAVRVPAQTRVFVDLQAGYEGVLVIDGVEIPTTNLNAPSDTTPTKPGQQVTLPPNTIYEPGNATLTFVPNEDALVDKFVQGLHTVKVIYWKTTEGRARASSYTWDFNVF